MLTGVRSYPVRYAEADEFEEDIWTIPGAKMKGPACNTPDFRVPLSEEAKRIINIAKDRTPNDFIFANHKGNTLSDASMSSIMKRAGGRCKASWFKINAKDMDSRNTKSKS